MIDEIISRTELGSARDGRSNTAVAIRIGEWETDLYLEKSEAIPGLHRPMTLKWWVFALDRAGDSGKGGHPRRG